MAPGLLLFFGLLYLVGAQDLYSDLSDGYRRGVDLALEQLQSHAHIQHHYRFLRTVDKAEIDSGFGVKYLYQHFLLKPTRCAKGTNDTNAQCPFRNDRPLMDCAVCYKTVSDEIEKIPMPYVHCLQKPRVTQEIKETRTEHCKKMTYNSGAPILMAVGTD